MLFPPFPFGSLDVLSLWEPEMWGTDTLSPHRYGAEDQGTVYLPDARISVWECWTEITLLQPWARSVGLNRSPPCPGWPGDGQDAGVSKSVQSQQQHICSTASRIYLLKYKGPANSPR